MSTDGQPGLAHQAARFSVWAPVLAVVLGILARVVGGEDRQTMGVISGGITIVAVGGGLIAAIYALLQVRRVGAAGIRGYAIAGLILNIGYVGLILASLSVLHKARLRAEERQRAALASQVADVAALASVPQLIPGSTVVQDERLGYRLEIPPGFARNRDPQLGTDIVSYIRAGADGSHTAVNIHSLGGRITDERIPPEVVARLNAGQPPGASIAAETATWQGHTVDVMVQRQTVDGVAVITYGAQIPLVPEAIQLTVGGPVDTPADQPVDYRALLDELLPTVHGNTNW